METTQIKLPGQINEQTINKNLGNMNLKADI